MPVTDCVAPAGHVANALDCDDSDTVVNPGASEVPYDGVDNDCADGDLADVDGDGHDALEAGGDDCDDENEDIAPGEDEVPYDGIDNDCDGDDADDLDGDGSIAAEAGGDDCDDSDPEVYAGAEENWANGVTDNDCDGAIEAVTLAYGADTWSGWRRGDGMGRRVSIAGDLDGDSRADVLVGSDIDTTLGPRSGALYRVDGSPGGTLESAAVLLPVEAGELFVTGLDSGRDVTSDGVADILVTSMGGDGLLGAAWLVDGDAWASGGDATVDEVDAGFVTASAASTYGPGGARLVGDVTGDGVEDIALGECCSTGGVPGGRGRVVVVSADAFTGTLDDADVVIEGPWEGAYMGYALDRVGDQDGDGLDDLLASATGGLTAAVLPGNASGDTADIAITLLYGEVTGTSARDIHDVDGDGRDDIAVIGVDDGIAVFTALHASPTRTLDSPTFSFSWQEHGGAYDVLPLGDLDGDDLSDTLVPQAWSDSGNQRLWVLPGAAVATGGSASGNDMLLSGISSVPSALFGYALARGGDVDGDGQDDVVLGAPQYSAEAENAGGATLVSVPR